MINIRDFGAVGDGITLDTAAVQKALDCCKKNGGTVVVPGGKTYKIGTIQIYSNTELYLESGAVLKQSDRIEDLRSISIVDKSNNETDIPSYINCEYNGKPAHYFIYATGENIRITGYGAIDGNEAVYYTESNPEKPSNALTIEDMSFTVVNNWKETSPTPDPTPSNPDKGTSSNSSSSSSSAVNYESEKPNPADKKAVEAYNFWQNAKAKVRTTPDGKTMRLFVPKDITYMPASMMETLYREKITLIITHNGKKIVIPAGKAMPKQKLKVYWTFESLEKLYQA